MEASAAPRPVLPRRAALVPARLLRVASDDKLVALVRQGSEPAFEVLYDRHHRGVLSFCRHMLGTREEAEDALQHTFMAAYRDMLGSDKEIQLRAWLYAIARNRCLSMLRSRRERPVDELEDVPTEGLAAAVERRQDLQDLLRDMAALPEDQRAALVLAEIGDLPHDEIAAVIGCPKDKVKALVFQARTSLHNSREARETSCTEIREMLSSLRGGSLRRTSLRRHLRECPGCREFQSEIKRQRQAMAVLLPVVPTLGLRESVLGAVFSSGGAAAAGTAATAGAGTAVLTGSGAAAGGGSAAMATKLVVVAAALGGGAAGATAVTDGTPAAKAPTAARHAGAPSPKPAKTMPLIAATPAAEEATDKAAQEKPAKSGKARRRGHGDRGKEFAKTRGEGNKRGLLGTQPGKAEDRQDKSQTERGQSVERKQAAQQKKATARAKKRAVRKAKKRAVPRRQINKRTKTQARPVPTPQPTPEPKAKPTPEPTPEPTPTPEPLLPPDPGKSKLG